MDGDVIRHKTERSQELEPEIDGGANTHLPEGEEAEHGEVEEVCSVSDFIVVAQAQACLTVCDGSPMGRIGEEGFVLLHAGAAEERGGVMRPYGLNVCEVDAF
ncbi:hypothetical protein J2X76_002065 [Neorhizobium sp. 2083]|nr:hypothetical protein [Neorhizobium sp. 2083]